ncbi:hypothetical protein EV360DRAFT_72010, partial [Lentinula raphanica]
AAPLRGAVRKIWIYSVLGTLSMPGRKWQTGYLGIREIVFQIWIFKRSTAGLCDVLCIAIEPDFVGLGESGTTIHDRILQNVNTGGKACHTSTFYTPIPVLHTNSYAYKEWLVIGHGSGEDSDTEADALIRHIARLGESQSVLRGRVPASFAVGNKLEIIEGPRMVTMPQLLFASSVTVVLCIYVLLMLPKQLSWESRENKDEDKDEDSGGRATWVQSSVQVVGNELEIIKGPRMMTTLQSLFAGCVGVILL